MWERERGEGKEREREIMCVYWSGEILWQSILSRDLIWPSCLAAKALTNWASSLAPGSSFYLSSMSVVMLYVTLCALLISVNIMNFSSIHVIRNDRISSLFIAEVMNVYLCQFFIHSHIKPIILVLRGWGMMIAVGLRLSMPTEWGSRTGSV